MIRRELSNIVFYYDDNMGLVITRPRGEDSFQILSRVERYSLQRFLISVDQSERLGKKKVKTK